MGKSIILSACLLLVCWTTAMAADPYAGRFVGIYGGEEYRLTLEAAGTYRYEGDIVIGGESLPLVARRFGERISGQAGGGDAGFTFNAEFSGEVLLLRDADGRVIQLRAIP